MIAVPWGLLAPRPLGFNPPRKWADAGQQRPQNAKRSLTTNSLFMETGRQAMPPHAFNADGRIEDDYLENCTC